jgi:hypothetical protein
MVPRIDHLMWGVPDLDAGVRAAERLFGVTAVPGGAHTGLGTRNALLGLGDGVYLEILGPDPAQPLETNMGAALQRQPGPALVTFAVASDDLPGLAEHLRRRGLRPRGPVATERVTPEGLRLEWDLLFVGGHGFGGLVPFFIDWRDCPHPSASLPLAAQLDALALGTPQEDEVGPLLADLRVPVTVARDSRPWLRASLTGAAQHAVLESTGESLGLRFA